MNKGTIKIEEFKYSEKFFGHSYILRLKTSFWGRLKFLFKGYKARFEIPLEIMWMREGRHERIY